MTSRAYLLGGLCVLACSVKTIDDAEPDVVRNECNTNSDCAGGRCSHGLCEAAEAEVGTLLFEVTAPATSGAEYASTRYLTTVSNLQTREARKVLNLEFGVVADVSGSFTAKRASNQTSCEFAFVSGGAAAGPLRLDDAEGIPAAACPGSQYAPLQND